MIGLFSIVHTASKELLTLPSKAESIGAFVSRTTMLVAGSASIATVVVVSVVTKIEEHNVNEGVNEIEGNAVEEICESSARSSALAFVSD